MSREDRGLTLCSANRSQAPAKVALPGKENQPSQPFPTHVSAQRGAEAREKNKGNADEVGFRPNTAGAAKAPANPLSPAKGNQSSYVFSISVSEQGGVEAGFKIKEKADEVGFRM